MTINTRRLRASLPIVAADSRRGPQKGREKPYVLWLMVFAPIAFIFAIHFISDLLARG
jgi:Na+/melibiose symporter-like transporter